MVGAVGFAAFAPEGALNFHRHPDAAGPALEVISRARSLGLARKDQHRRIRATNRQRADWSGWNGGWLWASAAGDKPDQHHQSKQRG